MCEAVFSSIIRDRKNGTEVDVLVERVTNLCVSLNIEDKDVCQGIIKLNAVIIVI